MVAKYFLFNLFPLLIPLPENQQRSSFFPTIALFMCKTEREKTMLMIHGSLTHKSLSNRSSIIYNGTTVSNDGPSLKCSHISDHARLFVSSNIHYLHERPSVLFV